MVSDLRQIAVGSAQLGYEVRSEGTGRPAAVFVHGYSGRSTGDETYGELLSLLEAEFTIYAFDLRGHGSSASSFEDWSLATVADDVAVLVAKLGIEGAMYIGHSIGGFTGMYCQLRHPGTFSKMCLINTASAEGGGHTPKENEQLLMEHGRDQKFLEGALQTMYVRGGDPRPHATAAALMNRRVHEAFYAEYYDLSIIEAISDIAVPVLALNGARDNVVPLSTQHKTAMSFPNCKEVIFTGEGHLLPIEAPHLVAREIIGFFKDGIE